ncbi:hypothetical protein Cadr_000013588 [Camelus dromedarius]|uniref:Uncharacterized protein n=1 Tax=Camelus dromedarius TaxID=9838 RepID=A0A5N4DEG9_CAMDR|nr:hypothetical protein Cadr_000013588 [Camelus dromedarius]
MENRTRRMGLPLEGAGWSLEVGVGEALGHVGFMGGTSEETEALGIGQCRARFLKDWNGRVSGKGKSLKRLAQSSSSHPGHYKRLINKISGVRRCWWRQRGCGAVAPCRSTRTRGWAIWLSGVGSTGWTSALTQFTGQTG